MVDDESRRDQVDRVGPSEEEADLIERAVAGDGEAFCVLAERHRRRVFAAAFHILRDEDEALDVSQDALLKAYRKLDTFEGRSSFGTWVARIATNTALNRAKQRKRQRERTGAELPDGDILADAKARGPVKGAIDAELMDDLRVAVEQLPPEQRAALLLCDVEGRSYAEIADILGCPKGTVMSRIHYARTKLRGLLSAHAEKRS